MNKSELVKKVCEKTELTSREAGQVVETVLNAVKEALGSGEKVTLVGFGAFGVKQRAERKGIHPRTGKPIKIPARAVPYFTAGKELKDAAGVHTPAVKTRKRETVRA